MGYFPNSDAGLSYEQRYCFRCIHNDDDADEPKGCPVMNLHYWHNYEECNKPDSFLHVLIPLNAEGENEQCAMFIEAEYEED